MARKCNSLLFISILTVALQARAQNQAPVLLLGPADWRPEHIPIPPGFARGVKFTGFEEARFAPGVFNNTSTNYFTYALAVSVNGTPEIGAPELKEFLETYYQGLSTAVGRGKQLKPDVDQMKAEVSPAKTTSGEGKQYEAKMPFYDSFTDGRKIVLNMEIRVIPRPASKKTYLMLLISTQGPEGEAWKKLREIGAAAKLE